jgi:hypothetical protein
MGAWDFFLMGIIVLGALYLIYRSLTGKSSKCADCGKKDHCHKILKIS